MPEEKTTTTEAVKGHEEEVTDKIINRNTEAEEAEPESELVQIGEHELGQPEASKLSELGYTEETIGKLSEDDIVDILENDIEADKGGDAEPVITAEIAQKYGGFAKNLIGKPIGELFQVIIDNNSEVGKLRAENKRLKALEQQTETKTDEEFSWNDFLDLEPEDQKKVFANMKKEAAKEALDMFKEQYRPLVEQSEKQTSDQVQKEFYDSIQKRLPEGLEAKDVIDSWIKKYGANLTQDEIDFYVKSPNTFVNQIAQYGELLHKNNQISDKDKNFTQNLKKKTAENVRKSIRNTSKNTVSKQYNQIPRGRYSENESLDNTVKKIIARNSS